MAIGLRYFSALRPAWAGWACHLRRDSRFAGRPSRSSVTLLAGMAPGIDQAGIPFLLGEGAHAVGLFDLVGFLLAVGKNFSLGVGRADVGDAEAQGGQRAALEAKRLHIVQQLDRRRPAQQGIGVGDHAAGALGGQRVVVERHRLGQHVVKHATPDRREDDVALEPLGARLDDMSSGLCACDVLPGGSRRYHGSAAGRIFHWARLPCDQASERRRASAS